MMQALAEYIDRHDRLLVLTGAGVSTASGIPDYRDANGAWKGREPIRFQEFMGSHQARQRYWARSMIGWPRFSAARPGPAHEALARLEGLGKIQHLITQNVDRLHQRAGSQRVIDLHGVLQQVICLECRSIRDRDAHQQLLVARNPQLSGTDVPPAPDGDAHLEQFEFSGLSIPECQHCGGILKPNVVFFGENVPRDRVESCYGELAKADAMLVVGSSLMVYSGFRFVRRAHEMGLPIAAINRGVTRADDLLNAKVEADCGELLLEIVNGLVA